MIMDNSVAFTALMLFWHQEEHPASKNRVVGMLICLERGADHLLLDWLMSLLSQIPSCLACLKSRIVLPF